MHPYVLHLLDDILLAHREEAPCDEGPQMSIEEELHAIEQWLIKGEGGTHFWLLLRVGCGWLSTPGATYRNGNEIGY